MFSIILLVLSAIPYGHEAEYADDVELNHVVTDCHSMTQLIFRDYTPYETRIYAWVLPKALIVTPGQIMFEAGGDYRIIRYKCFRESVTDYDPEIVDRQNNTYRRGLMNIRKGEK